MRTQRLDLGVLSRLMVMAATLGALALAALTPAAGADATVVLPRIPADLSASGSQLTIRPSTIYYTGDGTGLLGGTTPTARSGIHWSSWTTASALGSGDNEINNCEPSCAGGHFSAYPVKLEAWRPLTERGRLVFTRLTIWYTGKRPAGEPAHFTFTVLVSDGRFTLGPPDADGYCTHTEGQPKAAGCANITALPPSA